MYTQWHLLAGGGSFLASLPLPLIIGALKALEEPCYRGSGGHVGGGATTFHFFIFKILPTKFLKWFC